MASFWPSMARLPRSHVPPRRGRSSSARAPTRTRAAPQSRSSKRKSPRQTKTRAPKRSSSQTGRTLVDRLKHWGWNATKWGAIAGVVGALAVPVAWHSAKYFATQEHGNWVENIEHSLRQNVSVSDRHGIKVAALADSEDNHFDYVEFDDLPKPLVDALIATEDANFWEHDGVDPMGIARAAVRKGYNALIGGKPTLGGSTLAMQIAKNAQEMKHGGIVDYKIPQATAGWELTDSLVKKYGSRGGREKLIELYFNMNSSALRLHGPEDAARYYFDKPLKELGVVELAFIAGTYQNPTKLNPLNTSGEKREKAKDAAIGRTAHVLKRMLEEGKITPQEHSDAKKLLAEKGVPFKQGSVVKQPDSSATLALEELDALHEAGKLPEYWNQGRVEIATTLDFAQQTQDQYTLRHALTPLSIGLEGIKLFDDDVKPSNVTQPEEGEFYKVRLVKVKKSGTRKTKKTQTKFSTIKVAFGDDTDNIEYPTGIMDYESITRLATAWNKHRKGRNASCNITCTREFMDKFNDHEGKVFLASVSGKTDDGTFMVDIEQRPTFAGSYVHLESDGKITSLLGSWDNRDFNHAAAAHEPGSTLKPLLLAYAISHGWDITDGIPNTERPFFIGDRPWVPTNGHYNGNKDTTLWGMGVNSDNVATAYLLYHVLDKVSPAEFAKIAASVDMAQRRGENAETPKQFRERLRDKFGLNFTPGVVERMKYDAAKATVVAALTEEGVAPDIIAAVEKLPHGVGYDEVRKKLKGVRVTEKKKPFLEEITRETYRTSLGLQTMAAAARTDYRAGIAKTPGHASQGSFFVFPVNGELRVGYTLTEEPITNLHNPASTLKSVTPPTETAEATAYNLDNLVIAHRDGKIPVQVVVQLQETLASVPADYFSPAQVTELLARKMLRATEVEYRASITAGMETIGIVYNTDDYVMLEGDARENKIEVLRDELREIRAAPKTTEDTRSHISWLIRSLNEEFDQWYIASGIAQRRSGDPDEHTATLRLNYEREFPSGRSELYRFSAAKRDLKAKAPQLAGALDGIDFDNYGNLKFMIESAREDLARFAKGETLGGQFFVTEHNGTLQPAYFPNQTHPQHQYMNGTVNILEAQATPLERDHAAGLLPAVPSGVSAPDLVQVQRDRLLAASLDQVHLAGMIPAHIIDRLTTAQTTAEMDKDPLNHPDYTRQVAIKSFFQFIEELGIDGASQWKPLPSIVLGSKPIAPIELGQAYLSLTTGNRCEPYSVSQVKRNGKVIYTAEPTCAPVPGYTTEARSAILQTLQGVTQFGTATSLGGFTADRKYTGSINAGEKAVAIGGKTGTSMKNDSLTFVLVAPPTDSLGDGVVDPSSLEVHVSWLGDWKGSKGELRPLKKGGLRYWGSTSAEVVGDIYQQRIDTSVTEAPMTDAWFNLPIGDVNNPIAVDPFSGHILPGEITFSYCNSGKVGVLPEVGRLNQCVIPLATGTDYLGEQKLAVPLFSKE